VRPLITCAVVACLALAACGDSDSAGGDTQPTSEASAGQAVDDASPGGAASARPTVENPAARRFVDAVNDGNSDQVMATLAANSVVVDGGRRFTDPEAIRQWLETEVTGVDGKLNVTNERETSDGAVLTVDFASAGFSGSDLRYTFVTRRDEVVSLTLG
jgi:hypothetical protein